MYRENVSSFVVCFLLFLAVRTTGGAQSTQEADGPQMGIHRHASGRTGRQLEFYYRTL